MEKKIRAAIVGYGNIGKYALEAIEASPDMECVGVVRRNGAADRPAELAAYPVVKHISELEKVDVAILATPTRSVESYAKECLALGINTVDSFDIHTSIVELRRTLDEVAKAHNAVSVVAAGWDPGSDSVVRTLMESPDGRELHEFRSRPFHGTLSSRSRYRWRSRCPFGHHPPRHRHSPPYGLRRTRARR